jgi:hypothetical protein
VLDGTTGDDIEGIGTVVAGIGAVDAGGSIAVVLAGGGNSPGGGCSPLLRSHAASETINAPASMTRVIFMALSVSSPMAIIDPAHGRGITAAFRRWLAFILQ